MLKHAVVYKVAWGIGRGHLWALLPIVAVVGYLALGPVLYLLVGTLFDERGFTLGFFAQAYTSQGLGGTLWHTVQFAVGSAVVSVGVGATLGFLVARTDTPLKSLVIAASLVPLIIPGILHTIAWIFLASPRIGIYSRLLEPVLGRGAVDINTIWGMILVQGLHTAPLVFLLTLPAYRSMDPSLEEAANMCGARLSVVLRRITLPLIRPALYAAGLISVVTGLEAFEVPILLGSANGIDVVTSRIWFALNSYPVRFGEAGAYSLTLLALTTLGVYLYSRLLRRGKRFQTVTGKGFRPRTIQLGKWRWVGSAVVAAYFALAVVMPIAALVYASTQQVYSQPSLASIRNASLANYREIVGDSLIRTAFSNSLLLGVGSATTVMLLMALAAWVVARSRVGGTWVVDALSSAPIAIPSLVLGVALMFVYLRSPLPVYGTIWILFIAYVTRYLPYGMRYAASAMHQIGRELEEASESAGGRWWQTFRRIVLPLLMPGLIAGWIYVITVSFRELASSLLLYSPGNEVLSVVIWEQWQNGSLGLLAALGTLMVLTLLLLVVAMLYVSRRFGRGIEAEGR